MNISRFSLVPGLDPGIQSAPPNSRRRCVDRRVNPRIKSGDGDEVM